MIFNRQIWSTVAEQREDAYSVVGEAFGIQILVLELIADATSSATIRFGETLHFLYHEDNNITWERIISEVEKNGDSLAQIIRNCI